jgi:4-amino-4-deoxy-L-arabinose transferase-like glycosyltransferase
MRGTGSVVSEMPRLDAFDEEFGREPAAILRGQRRTRLRFPLLITAVVGAALVALAWPWVSADGGLRSEVQALLALPRGESADQQTQRLMEENEALRKEVEDLTQARQEAAERIASLEAAEQDAHPTSTYWYSDLAALSYASPFPPKPAVAAAPAAAAPTARRPATARTEGRGEARDPRRRDGGTPTSLDQQQ